MGRFLRARPALPAPVPVLSSSSRCHSPSPCSSPCPCSSLRRTKADARRHSAVYARLKRVCSLLRARGCASASAAAAAVQSRCSRPSRRCPLALHCPTRYRRHCHRYRRCCCCSIQRTDLQSSWALPCERCSRLEMVAAARGAERGRKAVGIETFTQQQEGG